MLVRKPVFFLPAAIVFAAGAMAQSGEQLVLEEVLVTAQFRTESLQDVPVSVAAVTGDKLKESGIDKIEDLQAYVPNLTMSETGIGTNIYIRGIGSGINQGFEQSTGMYVDGVYYGRAQLSRIPFLDLERVEVLRGPQNILYGKNSIAGALSMITAKPGDEFEGSVSALYEPEHDEKVLDLVLSGPITDWLGARFSYRGREMDGYIENLTLDRDEPERDEDTFRLTLDARPTDKLDVILKLEKGEFDVKGRQVEVVNESPSLNPALGGASWSQYLVGFGADPSTLDRDLDYKRSSNGDFSNNETDGITLTLNYDWNDYTLTYIGSRLNYEYEELCDCDFTGADLFFVALAEDYEQTSHEFRFVSPAGKTFEWIGGFYYQDSELDFADAFFTTPTSIVNLPINAGLQSRLGPFYPGTNPFDGPANQLVNIAVPRLFTQDSELWSVFAQVTWNIQNNLRLTLGGRYTDEEKEASRALTVSDTSFNELPVNELFIPGTIPGTSMGLDYLLARALKVYRHDLSGKRDEDNFAPLINAEFDLNEDVLLYATWTKGYKAGGYDARSNTPDTATTIVNPFDTAFDVNLPAGSFEYEDEQATTIELGAKTTLLDGKAELNIAVFNTEYEDLQVSIYDGVLGFNVGNAAEATTRGIELDGRFRVNQYLTLFGSLAYLDFEFDKFPNGQCTQAQRIAADLTVPGSGSGLFCDYKGKTNQYVADWSGTISADYLLPVTDRLDFRAVLDVIYTGDYNPSQNIDKAIEQDSYTKLNLRLALGDPQGSWEVALVGRNLTDEEVVTYANDLPLAANLSQSSSYYAFVERERTVAVQGTYRF